MIEIRACTHDDAVAVSTLLIAEFDVMKEGMAPEKAIDNAFRRVEEIFAEYPISQA